MIEHPILFNGPMVRANREGRKTQTRRVAGLSKINAEPDAWAYGGTRDGEPGYGAEFHAFKRRGSVELTLIRCPYGVEGDRLWTRETYSPRNLGGRSAIYRADGIKGAASTVQYLATTWVPSIHMPRWASRDTLEIISAHPERLHCITEVDVLAEGVTRELVSGIISPIALRAKAEPEHWINGHDQGLSFCRSCAEKTIRKLKRVKPKSDYFLDGGWATEGDSQAFCEKCKQVLDNSFTTYACEQELDHFAGHEWTLSPLDCLSLENIMGSYGWEDGERRDAEDLLAPKIHRIGFQALWDSTTKTLPWSKNPWVWRIEYR